jgi:hypothetical protein
MAPLNPSKSVFAMLRSVALPCGILMILLGLAAWLCPMRGVPGALLLSMMPAYSSAVLTEDRVALQSPFQMSPNRYLKRVVDSRKHRLEALTELLLSAQEEVLKEQEAAAREKRGEPSSFFTGVPTPTRSLGPGLETALALRERSAFQSAVLSLS